MDHQQRNRSRFPCFRWRLIRFWIRNSTHQRLNVLTWILPGQILFKFIVSSLECRMMKTILRVSWERMLFIQLCNCIGIVSRGHQQLMEVMDRSVRLHLCRDIEALMIRFLSGFTVDGLSKPWWAFAAGKYRTFISLCIQYNDYIIYYVTKNKKKTKQPQLGRNTSYQEFTAFQLLT